MWHLTSGRYSQHVGGSLEAREEESCIVPALLAWTFLSFGTCHVTSVETLKVQFTLFLKLVGKCVVSTLVK